MQDERENKQKHVDRKKKVKASEAGKEEGKTIKHRQVERQVKRKES